MRNFCARLAGFAVVAAMAWNSPHAVAEPCWAKFTMKGVSVTREPDGVVTSTVKSYRVESAGNVGPVSSDPEHPGGFVADFHLPGSGSYKFEYEGNVSRLRIRKDGALVYEGTPVPSYTGIRGGPLQIQLDVEGDVVIKVSDECG